MWRIRSAGEVVVKEVETGVGDLSAAVRTRWAASSEGRRASVCITSRYVCITNRYVWLLRPKEEGRGQDLPPF